MKGSSRSQADEPDSLIVYARILRQISVGSTTDVDTSASLGIGMLVLGRLSLKNTGSFREHSKCRRVGPLARTSFNVVQIASLLEFELVEENGQ